MAEIEIIMLGKTACLAHLSASLLVWQTAHTHPSTGGWRYQD